MPLDYSRRSNWRTGVHYNVQQVQDAEPGPRLVRYYSVKEVARELGVSEASVTKWAADGRLKGSKTSRRGRWRFKASEVMSFLRGNVGAIRR